MNFDQGWDAIPHQPAMLYDRRHGPQDRGDMKEYLSFIDVDPSDAKDLYQLLDIEGFGAVPAEDFLSGCMRLRGSARSLDLSLMMHENMLFQKKSTKHFKLMEKRLAIFESQVRMLNEAAR